MGKPIQTVLIYGYGVMGRGVAKTSPTRGSPPRHEQPRGKARKGCRRDEHAVESCEGSADLRHRIRPRTCASSRPYAEIEAAYSGNSPDNRR